VCDHIANVRSISPHMICYEEMRQTLRYSARAKRIVNRAVRNEDPQVVYIRELRAEVDRLQQLLKEAGGHEFTREYVLELEARCRQLEKKGRRDEETICGLRAELENAGISDPTLRAVRKDTNRGVEGIVSGAAVRQANEALQEQLHSATAEISRLQKELLDRAGAIASYTAQQEAEEKLGAALRQVDSMRRDIREREALLRRYSSFQLQWTSDIICNSTFDKINAIFRQCQGLLYAKDQQLSAVLTEGQMGNLVRLNDLHKKHEEETNMLVDRYRSAQRAAETEHAARDEETQQKHSEALSLAENQLKLTKESYEQEKKRMAGELDSLKFHYEDLLAKAAVSNEEGIQRLREQVGTSAAEKQKQSEVTRQMQNKQSKELKSLREDLAGAERRYEEEIARLRSHQAREISSLEADNAEKDRERRRVELEMADLRRDNLKLQADHKKTNQTQADRIKDLLQQQEALITISNAIVADWGEGSSSLGASIVRLQNFVSNPDYADFRQHAKELAFRGSVASSKASRPSTGPVVDAEREKELRNAVSRMKAAQASQKASIERLQRDLYEGVSKARGHEPSTGTENKENNSQFTNTPPPSRPQV